MYRISGTIWKNIREIDDITAISFENGRREFTYGGLNYVSAVHVVMEQSSIGRTVLLFRRSEYPDINTIERDEKYFRDIIKRVDHYDLNKMIQRPNKCQHDKDEDCLICSICGECREDLNEDDICPDCDIKAKTGAI